MDLGPSVLDLPTLHEDGSFVSAKVSRLVDLIREYDPTLDVQWIPPRMRNEGDPAFRIIHSPVGKPSYVAFVIQNEEDFNERVLAKIYQNDQSHTAARMEDLDAFDAAERALRRRAYEESLEEANDIAYHVLKSHKNTYRVNKDLVIRERGSQLI